LVRPKFLHWNRWVISGLRFLSLVYLLCSVLYAQAAPLEGFGPQNTAQLPLDTGNVVLAPKRFTLCPGPELTAQCTTLSRSAGQSTGTVNSYTVFDETSKVFYPATKLFFTLYPKVGLAAMAVKQENAQGWAEIIINPLNNTKATQNATINSPSSSVWMPVKDWDPSQTLSAQLGDQRGLLLTLQDYMKIFSKAYGAFWLNGVRESQRVLKSSPDDSAKVIPILMSRRLTVKHVRGNWLLVEIVDFDHTAPIGWLRWRDENGKLLMFHKAPGDTTVNPLILGGGL
jgi:hypothetical protein